MHDPRISDLMLERYALGEVTEAERRELEAMLERDPEARERLAALATSSAAILAEYPAGSMVPAIRRRAERQQGERQRQPGLTRRLLIGAPVLAAAAAAIAFAVLPTSTGTVDPYRIDAQGEVQTKGLLPALHVYRRAGDTSERLTDGAAAFADDVLQVSYLAVGRLYGVILSIDGRGSVTLHHPAIAGGDTSLLTAGEAALPHSYQLDDAPAFERFFLVTSDQPIDARLVLDAAGRLAREPSKAARDLLPLPPQIEQATLLLNKGEAR